MGRQHAKSDTGPEIDPTLKWAAKMAETQVRLQIAPSDLWAVNRLKDTPGRKLAQYLNGSLKVRKMYIVKIGPSIEWVVNRPKSHRADIGPKYIAGC